MGRSLDQILVDENPSVVQAANAKADEILVDINLAELRQILGKSQMDVTTAMGVNSPAIADIEQAGNDIRLSSLKRYVEAAGATLRLDVELPDGTHCGFKV